MFNVSNAFTKCIRLIDMNLRCQKSLLKSFYNLLYSKRLHSTCSYVSTITYLFWSDFFQLWITTYVDVALRQQQFSKHLFCLFLNHRHFIGWHAFGTERFFFQIGLALTEILFSIGESVLLIYRLKYSLNW